MIKLRCIRICVDDKRRCIGDAKKYFVYKAGGYLTWKFVIVVSSSQLQTTKKENMEFFFSLVIVALSTISTEAVKFDSFEYFSLQDNHLRLHPQIYLPDG